MKDLFVDNRNPDCIELKDDALEAVSGGRFTAMSGYISLYDDEPPGDDAPVSMPDRLHPPKPAPI